MSDTTRDLVIKPLAVGAAGGAMSIMLVPSSLKILGMPGPVGMGLIMAGSSFVNAVANETIYETLLSDNESELVYNATAPVITGTACAGAAWLMLGEHADSKVLLEFFALGAASEILGGYIDEGLLAPAMNL